MTRLILQRFWIDVYEWDVSKYVYLTDIIIILLFADAKLPLAGLVVLENALLLPERLQTYTEVN